MGLASFVVAVAVAWLVRPSSIVARHLRHPQAGPPYRLHRDQGQAQERALLAPRVAAGPLRRPVTFAIAATVLQVPFPRHLAVLGQAVAPLRLATEPHRRQGPQLAAIDQCLPHRAVSRRVLNRSYLKSRRRLQSFAC